ADITRFFESGAALGHHGARGGRGGPGIDGDDATEGRIPSGAEIELIALRADERIERVPGAEQRLRLRARVAQVEQLDAVLLIAVKERDDEVAAVVGDAAGGDARRGVLHLVHQTVLLLGRAERMEV